MPQNALYSSPDIQNEIIHTIANCLREMIVDEMNGASFYTLMCDGAKDKRGNEILSIAFRYIVEKVLKRCYASKNRMIKRPTVFFKSLLIKLKSKALITRRY